MDLIAIVPVRAGSKGLPGKNLRPLAGKPLYRHAVDQALALGARCILTTDATDLHALSLPGLTVLARPDHLARDDTPMDPVIAHALDSLPGPARVVLLQPTSPLRNMDDLRAAIALHEGGAHDLVMTVTPTDAGILKYGMVQDGRFRPVSDPAYCFTNRQSLPPVYRPNGAVYVFDADWFRARGRLATDRIGAVVMPPERSHDIDTAGDFARVEALMP
jgi:CMP-N,N'-diacetyllegionaminic acid synthase